ncbi:MAG: hypothetical protein K2X81_01030, partial [Candidatus Obscuribacterales bacterium]|nr:hypothetical protein [Candidatus Obscuribacterales bacterium]
RKTDAGHLRGCIGRLNRSQTIALCVKLNLLTSGGRVDGLQALHQEQTDALMSLRADGFINSKVVAQIDQYRNLVYQQTGQPPMIFGRAGLLEMIRWVSLWGSDSASARAHTQNEYVQKSFMDALLSSADLFFQRSHKHFPAELRSGTLQGDELEAMRRHVQPAMRLMMDYSAPIRDPLLSLGRARLLLLEELFLKNPQYADEFKSKHDGLEIEQYLTCAAFIVMVGLYKLREERQRGTLINALAINTANCFISVPSMLKPFATYLKFKAQTADELAAAVAKYNPSDPDKLLNLKFIRDKPLLLDQNGHALVIDAKLLADSISVGSLFMLLNDDKKHNRAVFADFGYACHRYAFRLVDRCNKDLQAQHQAKVVVAEPECQYVKPPKNKRSLADIAIIDDDAVAIFETKGLWFNDAALETADAFWKEINRLYGKSVDQGKESRKGYVQLADVIKLLSDGSAEPVGEALPIQAASHIYPVLLVHDEIMNQPYLPHLLALNFVREFDKNDLPASGSFEVGKFHVHSLIVMSFNELEVLQSRRLDKPINSYLQEYSAWSATRLESVSDFFDQQYPELAWRLDDEQMLRKSAIDALNDIAFKCFGHGSPVEL